MVSNCLLTFGPECHPEPRRNLSSRMTRKTKPPSWSHSQAPLGLGCPRGQAHRTLLLVLFCSPCSSPPGPEKDKARPFAFPSEEAQHLRLRSPALPPLPQSTLFQGIRDLFYLHSLKKLVAKVTGAGTAGSLPWGRGSAPKQLSVGAVPAGAGGLASLEETPPGKTHSFLLLCPCPPTSLHCLPSSWGSPPALKKCSLNKAVSPCSPLPLQGAGLSHKPEHAGLAPSSPTHCGLAGQKASRPLCLRSCAV